MKSRMTFSILALMATALVANSANAQGETKERPVAVDSVSNRPAENFIEVNFAGGSVGEYIEMLKKADPNVSVIVTQAAASVHLPKIAVKKIKSDAAVALIENCFDHQPLISVQEDFINKGDMLFTIKAVGNSKEVVVWDLQPVVGTDWGDASKKRFSEFLIAAETGLKMLGEGQGEIKVHEETKLLFFSGSRNQIRVIEQIIENIAKQKKSPVEKVGPNRASGRPSK